MSPERPPARARVRARVRAATSLPPPLSLTRRRPPRFPALPSHLLARRPRRWGADWGAKGYILLARGAKFNPSGQCGIQMAASYPTKA